MPSTYTLIKGETIGSSASSYTFTAIPSTYTDLVVRMSVRSTHSDFDFITISLNSNTTDGSSIYLRGDGSTANSNDSGNAVTQYFIPGTGQTSNTFGSCEIYLSNYTVSAAKPIGTFAVGENNATFSYITAVASLHTATATVTSIGLTPAIGQLTSGSSFYLYGIKNS